MKLGEVAGIAWAPRCVYPVSVGFTQSRKAVDRLCRAAGFDGHKIDPCDGHCVSFIAPSGEAVVVLWLPKKRERTNEMLAVIAHECLHAVQFIKETIRETHMSHEAEAYLLQWLMVFALDEWRV